MSFFNELKRRNVVKVGVAYAVAAWLLLQLTEVLTDLLEIGPEVGKIVIVLLIVGFVPALIFAWAFELTPEGIKREKDVDRTQSITGQTGRKLDFVIIGMLVLVAGYFIWESRFKADTAEPSEVIAQQSMPVETAQPTDSEESRKSIVVLPFVNMSNDPDQEFFSDGLSEEILNALVKIRELRVISRTSAFAFKGKDVSIPDIAEKLDVSHVLEGSVRKAGNDVRITAQLIEVESDSHLWSEAYNRSLENIFEIQAEISEAIANALQVELGTEQASDRPTDNLEAYQMFLRGRHLYQDRGGENLDRAMAILKEVTVMEPGFADAWANLAGASLVRSFQVDEEFERLISQARHAARKAIESEPGNGFAHAVLGLLHIRAFEWEEAMTTLDRAIELNPYEPNSLLWKGIGLNILGYNTQALEYLLRAEDIDPIWFLAQSWIVFVNNGLGDIEAVGRHSAKAHDINSETSGYELGIHGMLKGDLDEAEKHWSAEELRRSGTDELVRKVFAALRDESRRQEAIQFLLENEEMAGSRTVFPYLWLLDASDEALTNMDEIINSGRGLRVGVSLTEIWAAYNREYINAPGVTDLFKRLGVADYWRKHGNPDFCQVEDEKIECGDP